MQQEMNDSKALTTQQLSEVLARVPAHELLRVRVIVHAPGGIGPMPAVDVTAAQIGFDWDSGSLLLSTEQKLSQLSQEDVAAIRQSVAKGQSWHAYQAWKTLTEQNKLLEAEITLLRSQAQKKQGGSDGL